jgi:hypothetical protein
MRPPSKRGTAVIPVEQQRNNSIFKMSLRSWQQQYKAQRTPLGSGQKQLAQAAQA